MLPTSIPNWSTRRFAVYGLLALVFGFVLAAATSGWLDAGVSANAPSVLGVVEERPDAAGLEVAPSDPTGASVPSTSTVAAPSTISADPAPAAPSTTAPSTTRMPSAPAATTTPPTTTSSTTVPPTSSTVQKTIGEQAEEILDFPWRQRFPNWTLVWAENRSGVRALTFPDRKVIEMYVRPGDDPQFLARVLAHELGHVADIELNDDADRVRWREVRGIPDSVFWWPQGDSYDFDTGAGDFAEGFATLLVGSQTKSRVAGAPTAAQLAVMAELIG